ncbi:MAG: glycosyltransferase family protein [Actinomycetes bacterium]
MAGHEPRLLIYSQDGLGLGHLRRTTLLATELLRELPGASALTVSDSPLGQFFSTMPGHDYLKLPSIRKAGPGDWQAVSLSSSFGDVLEMRRQLIVSAVTSFDPDVVLVDHMPHGAMGELVPALQMLRNRPVRTVLGLRDILDAPDVVRSRWAVEGAYAAVEDYYDEVLVYGSQDVLDVSREYCWPEEAARRLHYCGYVCAPATNQGTRGLRSRYLRRGEREKLVLVMAGGGADAYPVFSALLDAAPEVHAATSTTMLMVTGPFLPAAQQRELARRARGLPVNLLRTVTDSTAYMLAADLVVAMAGYNTTAEVLSTGTPALLVPRAGPSAEQRTRARLFAERGWVRSVDPHQLGPDVVAEAVVNALAAQQPSEPVSGPDLGGRQAAAARLLGTLRGDAHANGSALPHPRAIGASDDSTDRLLGVDA